MVRGRLSDKFFLVVREISKCSRHVSFFYKFLRFGEVFCPPEAPKYKNLSFSGLV